MKSFIYLVLGICLMFVTACKNADTKQPEAYVVMVSFDAFRWDFADIYDTPNLDQMGNQGVKAQALIPSFPTKTFPNHYTLVTGLYPDNHGIINNSFHAPDLDGVYQIGDRTMVRNPDAYFGEPIWVTAEEQGVKAASYFWVGSEAPIRGMYPSYWEAYDETVPYERRVDQVINWLKRPESKRPGLVLLYFDEPDHTAHSAGPEHPATGEVVAYLDSILGYLRTGIASLDYGDKVNLIVVSDHGMGPISPDKYVNLYDYVKEGWIDIIIGGNPVYLIDPAEGYEDSIVVNLNAAKGVSAWQKEDIPDHLHYGNSPRFPGIVVVSDSTWSIGTGTKTAGYTGGAHGYDNAFTDMHSIFYAEGPAFKKGISVPSFSNIEVYNIVSHVLGLDPAQNDGELSRVSEIFSLD